MKALVYEAHFYELGRNATSIVYMNYEIIYYFVQGLRLPIHMATQSLVVVGRPFAELFIHTRVMEKIHREVHNGSN